MLQAGLVNSVAHTVGRGQSRRAIFSSLSLAILILFYSLTVASYFRPDVYRFEDRTTYHQYFEDRYIFSRIVDNAIIDSALLVWVYFSFVHRIKWLILLLLIALFIVGVMFFNSSINQVISIFSLPSILSVYILSKKKSFKKVLQIDSNHLTVNYFLISFTVLALASIFLSMTGTEVNDPFIDIMTLLARYTPIVMVMLIFSVFVRIILKQVLSIIPVRVRSMIFSFTEPFSVPNYRSNNRIKIVLLSCFMSLSVFIVLIPHLGDQQHRVGEDTTLYAEWIDPMKDSDDLYHLLRLAFVEISAAGTGDRPLSLLILHGLSSIFETVYAFEIVLPAFLAPLLVLIIYFLTKELTSNAIASFLSAFITAISFQAMIGMYAGFYATWIGLIFGYLSILFALQYLNRPDKKILIWLSASMIALLFSHVYTWTVITAFLIIFMLVLKWKRAYYSRSIKVVLIIIIVVFLIDFVRSYLIGLSSGIERNVIVAEGLKFGLSQMGAGWSNVVRAVEVHLGGIFGNIIILSLALYSAIMLRFKDISSLFMMVFLSIGILPLLFGDKIVQSRVLYDIPFQIPAAIALTNIFISRNGKLKAMAVAASLLAISIYTMSNLGISPR